MRESILFGSSESLALLPPRVAGGGAIMTTNGSGVTVEYVVQTVVASHQGQRGSLLPILHVHSGRVGLCAGRGDSDAR